MLLIRSYFLRYLSLKVLISRVLTQQIACILSLNTAESEIANVNLEDLIISVVERFIGGGVFFLKGLMFDIVPLLALIDIFQNAHLCLSKQYKFINMDSS